MSDLAAQTSLTASGLSRAVDRLEAVGLATRESCAVDRRVAYAVLTSEGIERMDAALPVHLRHIGELVNDVLEPEEMAAFAATLRKLRDVVNPCAVAGTGATPVAPARA